MYGAVVLCMAAIGALVFGSLKGGPAQSPSSPSASASSGSAPIRFVTPPAHVYHGLFRCIGKRGAFSVAVAFPDFGKRSWDVASSDFKGPDPRFGQYARLAGGHGKHVEAGGHASAWYARLVGFVIPNDGPKQRVVIKLKGRPGGTFVLIPTQAGVFKRDSGTQSSAWLG